MTRILASLLVGLLSVGLALPGCSHVTPVVADCVADVRADLLPAVETALVGDDYVSELTKLVAQFGECVIRKGVVQVVGEVNRDLRFAQKNRSAQVKYEHGQNWLAAHPGP